MKLGSFTPTMSKQKIPHLHPFIFLTRALFRNPYNIYLTLIQPFLLILTLTLSLSIHFSGTQPLHDTIGVPWTRDLVGSQDLGIFYLHVRGVEFFAASVVLITLLLASQYGNQAAHQFRSFPSSRIRTNNSINRRHRLGLGSWFIIGYLVFVLLCLVALAFFTQLFFSLHWPWMIPGFWVLVIGLLILSISWGFLLGTWINNQDWTDLLLAIGIFSTAILGGSLFPYSLDSPLWNLTHLNPFSILHSRMVHFFLIARSPGQSLLETSPLTTFSVIELWVFALALGSVILTLVALGKQNRVKSSLDTHFGPSLFSSWFRSQKGVLLSALGLVVLPVVVRLIAPSTSTPTDSFSYSWFSWGPAISFFPSFLGPATLLILLMSGSGSASLVKIPNHWRRYSKFLKYYWIRSFGIGLVAILGFMVVLGFLAELSVDQMIYSFFVLVLFHGWVLALFGILGQNATNLEGYWTTIVATSVALAFLGGSLWDPSRLTWGKIDVSYFFPQGLLIYRSSYTSVLIVLAQILLLSFFALRQKKPRNLSPERDAPNLGGFSGVHHQTLISLRLSERKRILDEIHDTLGHGITGALWQIRSAQGMDGSAELKATLDRAALGLEESLVKIRTYLRDGQPRSVQDWSQLISTIEAFQACPINLTLEGDPDSFHPQTTITFVRVIQELLTNALRYGSPKIIGLRLIRSSGYHRLEYSEHGNGWGPQGPRMGFGLSKLSITLDTYGGSFHLAELPNLQGIQVIAVLPNDVFPGGNSSGNSHFLEESKS